MFEFHIYRKPTRTQRTIPYVSNLIFHHSILLLSETQIQTTRGRKEERRICRISCPDCVTCSTQDKPKIGPLDNVIQIKSSTMLWPLHVFSFFVLLNLFITSLGFHYISCPTNCQDQGCYRNNKGSRIQSAQIFRASPYYFRRIAAAPPCKI